MSDALDALRRDGAPELAVRAFERMQAAAAAGPTFLRESALDPVDDVPHLDDLTEIDEVPEGVLCLRLNGGLGTSMGLSGPKALLPVRGQRTFLDLVLDQAEDDGLPLVLMDSYRTEAATTEALARRGEIGVERFAQHRVPRLDAVTGRAVSLGADGWSPPGHGDLFLALQTRGVLERWLAAGYRTLFVANIDNLGARYDVRIASWMRRRGVPMVMEVTERTEVDRKGGHLVRHGGRWGLREKAQVHPDDMASFLDIERHGWFNTNNLWFDLEALHAALLACDGLPPLPVFTNPKRVRSGGALHDVVQLESAMGSALAWLPGATPLAVDRSRFSPVKTTSDLLRVRSDATVEVAPGVLQPWGPPPVVELDPLHYRTVEQLDRHFPQGAPSLRGCSRLHVTGPVTFRERVACMGDVTVSADRAVTVPKGTLLRGLAIAAAA